MMTHQELARLNQYYTTTSLVVRNIIETLLKIRSMYDPQGQSFTLKQQLHVARLLLQDMSEQKPDIQDSPFLAFATIKHFQERCKELFKVTRTFTVLTCTTSITVHCNSVANYRRVRINSSVIRTNPRQSTGSGTQEDPIDLTTKTSNN